VPGGNAEKAIQATQERVASWLERLVNETRAKGISVDTEVEWSEDWRKAIVTASARQKSVLVIKNMTQHSRFVRMVRETSDWTLIRECNCPVLLVKTGRPFRIEKMLVAVKHDPGTDVYERANDEILSAARSWSTDLGASLHAVTCYEEGMHPDRQRFADRCGLDRNQVSAAIGSPEKVIAETAAAQGSDLVVIARVARPDSPSMLGNTARKVVDEIDTEVLILPVNAAPLG
jgi:universal stress protein E